MIIITKIHTSENMRGNAMPNSHTKKVCILAIGIALYAVLSLCIQVPVFENYYLCLGYIVMAVYCYSFGSLHGTAVGFFGVILYCFLTNGLRGMPGWAVGNIIIGFSVGTSCKLTTNMKCVLFRHIIIAFSIIISTAVAMLGIKSVIECFLYSQPFVLRTMNNIYAFVADSFVLIFSLPICYKINQMIRKHSLDHPIRKE